MMIFILFWIGFAVVVGVAANTRGRSFGGWFFLALAISPLLAGVSAAGFAARNCSRSA